MHPHVVLATQFGDALQIVKGAQHSGASGG